MKGKTFTVRLDVPAFKSKYGIPVYRVEPEMANKLVEGQTYNLWLEKQDLKQGKDGKFADHFFWGITKIGGTDVTPRAQPAENAPKQAAGTFRAMPPGVGEVDPTRRSIERQVALKAASELTVALLVSGGQAYVSTEEVTRLANDFYDWLSGNGATKTEDADLFPPEERSEERDVRW